VTRPEVVARTALGLVLLAAGIGKLVERGGFRLAPLLLGDVAGPVLVASVLLEDALPGVEVTCGAAMLFGVGRWTRHAVAIVLAASFVAAAAAMPPGVRCHCFGAFGGLRAGAGHGAVAVGLLGLAVTTVVLEVRSRSGPQVESRS
jgi:hypothetical protein